MVHASHTTPRKRITAAAAQRNAAGPTTSPVLSRAAFTAGPNPEAMPPKIEIRAGVDTAHLPRPKEEVAREEKAKAVAACHWTALTLVAERKISTYSTGLVRDRSHSLPIHLLSLSCHY